MAAIQLGTPEFGSSHYNVMDDICCVACHRPTRPLKLLMCFHAMCLPCVREHIDTDGTVSCFRCLTVAGKANPGAHLEESLADWPGPVRGQQVKNAPDSIRTNESPSTGHEAAACTSSCPGPVCQSPECEGECEPATSHCVDCNLDLCEDHEKFHLKKRSRSTRDHTLQPLDQTTRTRTNMTERACPLHPHLPLKSYCDNCECQTLVCERCSAKSHSDHSHCLKDIQEAADRQRAEWKERLSSCSESWREKLSTAGMNITLHIEQINGKVERLSAEITEEFEAYINSVKQRRDHLLNELDVLRWQSLKELEKQSDHVELQAYQLDCCEHLVSTFGEVQLLEARRILESRLDHGITTALGEAKFDVSFQRFHHTEIGCITRLGALANPGQGEHSTAVQIPRQVFPSFDPFTCNKGLNISPDGSSVYSTEENGTVPVSTLGSFCHGIVECRMMFEQYTPTGGAALGVVLENCRETQKCTPSKGKRFLGWFSRDSSHGHLVGSTAKLGGEWRTGDVIVLRLDSDQHTLTGKNQRTGFSEIIHVPVAADQNPSAT
eukprot:scpid76333/ scgid1680/ E3 ubiquitin-protein ligase TRIM33; Ectodermin homolog; Transcription intermediary factor 1-gamma; Tripartite motif-containing protein 33